MRKAATGAAGWPNQHLAILQPRFLDTWAALDTERKAAWGARLLRGAVLETDAQHDSAEEPARTCTTDIDYQGWHSPSSLAGIWARSASISSSTGGIGVSEYSGMTLRVSFTMSASQQT